MYLITGATGNVGQELVKQLSAQGVALRVVSRDRSKLASLDNNIEKLEGDMLDETFIDRALTGVEKVFLFPVLADEYHRSGELLVKHAKAKGVKHIVMLSSMAANDTSSEIGRLHREKEEQVEKSGVQWTFVRPGAFMSNTLQWLPSIKSEGKVFNPTGEGRLAPISPFDIAAAAAKALTTEEHAGKIYSLTGPELLAVRDQIATITDITGEKIQCVDVPTEAMAEMMKKTGIPGLVISGLTKMWERVKSGKAEWQTDDLQTLTGSRGETFASWCQAHKSAFLN